MIPEDIKKLFQDAHADKMGRTEAYARLVDKGEDLQLVEQYLVTEEQATWLKARLLTLQRLIDGKYAPEDAKQIQKYLHEWNLQLGVPWFQEDQWFNQPQHNPYLPHDAAVLPRTRNRTDIQYAKKYAKEVLSFAQDVKDFMRPK